MYDHLSEHAQKRFLKRIHREISKIYEGIGVKNLKVKTKGENAKDKELLLLKLRWIRVEEQLHLSMRQNL